MRKSLFVAVLVAALAVAAPAFAAGSVSVTGSASTTLAYDDFHGLWGYGNIAVKVGFAIDATSPIKASVSISSFSLDRKTQKFQDGWGAAFNPTFNVSAVTLEAKGALLKGLPEVTTRFGSVGAAYSDWVASDGGDTGTPFAGRGFQIDGLSVGPVSLGFTNFMTDDAAAEPPVLHNAAKVSASVAGANVSATVVTEPNAGKSAMDLAVEGSISPLSGVSVTGAFSQDGHNEGAAYKFTADIADLPLAGLKLNAAYRAVDDKWAPPYAKKDADGNYVVHDLKTGVKGGASYTVAGVTVGATADMYTKRDKTEGRDISVSASTSVAGFDLSTKVDLNKDGYAKTTASAGTSLETGVGKATAKYTLTHTPTGLTHKGETSLTTAVFPVLPETTIASTVTLDTATKFVVSASTTLPNGISLKVGYANYDQTDDVEPLVGEAGKPDGLFVKASMGVTF